MICVIIGRGKHSSVLEEWEAAAAAGAGLVELRGDCLRREPDLKRLLAKRFTPVVFTLRRGPDGGLWRGDEEKRQKLLREAIALGVDYVDLELDIAKKIPRFGTTQRIVSYHNTKKVPDDLVDIARQCAEANADIVKVACQVSSIAEAARVMKVAQEVDKPTIAVAMGEVGLFTRILGAKYGAPFAYGGFNPERSFAPGLPMLATLQKDYLYDQITEGSQVFAVVGDPVAQSLSPAVHNAAFREMHVDAVYVPIHAPDGKLAETLDHLAWLDIRGLSVTIPHKEAVIPLCSQVDGAVEHTHSCNTVVNHADGRRVGHNTDYRAAMESLEQAFFDGNEAHDHSPLLGKQALVLGSGGVARSIAYGLQRRGAGVIISGRSDEKANALAEEVGCRTVNWGQRASTVAEVLVNCTPVGMHPDVDDTPMPPAGFRQGCVVFDTVYHPENTMFLKLARERGCVAITGVDMFVRQAAHQFHLFTAKAAPLDSMRATVKRKLGPLRH